MEFSGVRYSLCHDEKVEAVYEIDEDFWTMRRGCQPIALVIFDAFDTLITPRIPPHLQYADEARKHGIDIDDERVKAAFKSAFEQLAKEHPLYGLHSGLPTADDWWLQLIEQSMLRSGVPMTTLQPIMARLGPALLRRFASAEAYQLSEGIPETLKRISNTHQTGSQEREGKRTLTLSMATNSDERILEACKALGLGRFLDLDIRYDPQRRPTNIEGQGAEAQKRRVPVSGPTLSYDVGFEKPDKRFFHAAVQRAFPDPVGGEGTPSVLRQMCQQTLYVGDHFSEDYLGARRAGLQAVWLQRSQPWPTEEECREAKQIQDDQASGDSTPGNSSGLLAVSSMLDIVQIVESSWR